MFQEGEGYQLVKEVLKGSKPEDWKTINRRLKTKMDEKGYDFIDVTGDYMIKVSQEPKLWENQEEKRIFKGIFYEELKKKRAEEFIVVFAMTLQGIDDIMNIDITARGSKKLETFTPYFKKIYLLSKFDNPVLIIGETGTSKEFLAKALHLISQRPLEKFVEINCAAIPEELLEGELFGYEKGAFTGAVKKKIGRFVEGNGGTIFLDEIGKMAPYHQAKVLKAIDEKEFTPIGGKSIIKIDAKFIAAAQPVDMIKEDGILPDLRYRLAATVIRMPTLNDRLLSNPERIINNSLRRALEKYGLDFNLSIATDAIDMIKKSNFKGNYRELESVLMQAAISAESEGRKEILSKDLEFEYETNNMSSKTTGVEDYMSSIERIPLKNILDYVDKIRGSIVEAKVKSIMKDGKSLRRALADEGVEKKEYQNFLKKIRGILGTKVRSLKGLSS